MNTEQKWALTYITLSQVFNRAIPYFILSFFYATLAKYPNSIVSVFLGLTGTVCSLLFLQYVYSIKIWEAGFVRNRNVILKWGLGLGALLALPRLAYHLTTGTETYDTKLFVDISGRWASALPFIALAVILAPVAEELLYRGLIFTLLKEKFHIGWAYVGSTLLFAAGHSNFPQALISGLIYCWIFDKSRSLGAVIVAHAVVNLFWLLGSYSQAY